MPNVPSVGRMQTEPLCWLPYYHAEINTDGKVRPCCQYRTNWIDNISEYNSKDRSEFEQNKLPDPCWPCHGIKNSYQKIKMEQFSKIWPAPTQPSLRSLILSLDNTCSKSCVMCTEYNSTTIGNLRNNRIKQTWDFSQIEFNELELLTITGGEPLQSNKMDELCKKLLTAPLKEIHVITSLYQIREKNLLALESVNKPLSFRISIDGPWDLYSWIRGIEYDNWMSNLEKIRRHKISWQITIGSYNVFALPETLDFIETLVPNSNIQASIVLGPNPAFCITGMPIELKQKIKDKIERYTVRPNNQIIVQTALEQLSLHKDSDWEQSMKTIEELALLRGETRKLSSFIHQYLDK